jgi:hypothetical protein
MKTGFITRRRFLLCALAAFPLAIWGDADWVEPQWLKVRTLRMTKDTPSYRLVHFTDVHHKGDRAYFEKVVKTINHLSPDAVCFTGDLIEHKDFVPEALQILEGIKSPVYGVPGNHDYWSRCGFAEFRKSFSRTGGAWLMDSQVTLPGGKIHLTGVTCLRGRPANLPPRPGGKNIMLLHYPLLAERVQQPFDLMLAGHSHGGQVRIPFYGAIMLPYWVGKYDLGLFRVPAGQLYVNPGIGYIATPIRFNCRPEITVFEI